MTDHREIVLSSGDVTLVDAADYPLIAKYGWYLFVPRTGQHLKYARAKINGKEVYLHRFLLNPPRNLDIDHKDRDELNNRRANLRLCTDSQNLGNKRIHRNNTSGYKGVYCLYGKWRARVGDGKGGRRSLGLFTNKDDAARAYNKAALEQWGEFARVNDIPSG